MTKHPLLPDCYIGDKLQTQILIAMEPYVTTQRDDVANPQMKWNLNRAWSDAETLLATSRWARKENDDILDVIEIIYELAADTEAEIHDLQTIIAGLVANKCLHPESALIIARIEHKKGGEMTLVIPITAAEILQKLFPEAHFPESQEDVIEESGMLAAILRMLGLRK